VGATVRHIGGRRSKEAAIGYPACGRANRPVALATTREYRDSRQISLFR